MLKFIYAEETRSLAKEDEIDLVLDQTEVYNILIERDGDSTPSREQHYNAMEIIKKLKKKMMKFYDLTGSLCSSPKEVILANCCIGLDSSKLSEHMNSIKKTDKMCAYYTLLNLGIFIYHYFLKL